MGLFHNSSPNTWVLLVVNMKRQAIQKTLFGEDIILEYYGKDIHGNVILIPNFQPYDDNPRLDVENEEGKRDNNKRRR